MEIINITLALSNIGAGILVIAVCIPLLRNKIGMNRWYGFRFRKSFSSDEHWYAINRYGARKMICWSFAMIALSMLSFMFPIDGQTLLIILACSPFLLLIPAMQSWLFAIKL